MQVEERENLTETVSKLQVVGKISLSERHQLKIVILDLETGDKRHFLRLPPRDRSGRQVCALLREGL